MEKLKKLLKNKAVLWSAVGVVAAAAIIVAIVLLSGGADNGTTTPTGDQTYTVQVTTNAGKALSGLDVFVYADSTLADMVAVAKTDKDGVASFTAAAGEYAVVFKGVPAGYPMEESYPVTGTSTQVVLTATLITDADLAKDTFSLDGVMFDFSVTDTEGNSYVLSELLAQKKAVVLNFWFANCNPCKAEFPFLQEAWETYSDDVALIAVSPVDDAAAVAQFRTEQGLTIPMASVDATWQSAFGLMAYPTTVVIDRFGNINLMHVGSVPNAELFANMFAYYAAEDYEQQSGLALEDFAAASEKGTEANPLEFGGVTEFEVTLEPGKSVYCNVYKISGMLLTVQDETVSIAYNENTYLPENGVVTFPVEAPDTYTPVKLVFTNTGSEKKTYKVTLSYPAGTMGNPFELTLGNFSVDVPAGNDQGVYYTYVAEENGELTLECVGATEGVNYTFTLYNLNTYVYMAHDPDADSDTLTIAVNKGDQLQFTAGSLPDENNEYPAAKLDFVASFVKKEVAVTDPTDATNPAPTDPKPTDPKPTDPKPTDPTPTEPKATEPKATEPKATEPKETEPKQTEPKATEPTQTDPPETEPEEDDEDWDAPHTELYVGKAYHITAGSNPTPLKAGQITYFLFTPTQSGQYRFSCSTGTLSYYANNLSFIWDQKATLDEYTTTSCVNNVKDSNLGSSYLIGVQAPAGVTSGTVTVTRIGDAVLGWEDRPYTPYAGTYEPKTFNFTGGGLKYVNITGRKSDFVPVLGSDGYYHLNSASGPLLYVQLKAGEYPDQSLNTILNSNRPVVQGYVKDENGNILAKEEYNDLLQKYIDCSDEGLYPMTADLMRILKTQNDNWYLYLASENPNINKDLAWMCNVCYVP